MRPRLLHRGTNRWRNNAAVTAPASGASDGIAEIGDLALEHLVIALPQRHPPQWVGLLVARREQVVGQRIIVGEQCRQIGAERHARCAGQRGEVDDQLGLALPRRG